MNAYAHRFDFGQFFAPRKPRRPWVRLLLGLVGIAVLVALVAVSVVVGVAMISAGLLLRLWKKRNDKRVQRDSRVVDGEYRVVDTRAVDSRALPSA
jgi:hypothetical protein